MTFDQIRSLWTGGKKKKGHRVRSIEDVRRLARDWRKLAGI